MFVNFSKTSQEKKKKNNPGSPCYCYHEIFNFVRCSLVVADKIINPNSKLLWHLTDEKYIILTLKYISDYSYFFPLLTHSYLAIFIISCFQGPRLTITFQWKGFEHKSWNMDHHSESQEAKPLTKCNEDSIQCVTTLGFSKGCLVLYIKADFPWQKLNSKDIIK